jgi:hypothetical protein
LHAAFAINDCGAYVRLGMFVHSLLSCKICGLCAFCKIYGVCVCVRVRARSLSCLCKSCVCVISLSCLCKYCVCDLSLSSLSSLSKYGVCVCVRALSLNIVCVLSSSSTNSEHETECHAHQNSQLTDRQGKWGPDPTHWRSASVGGKDEDLLPAQRS